MIQPNIQPIVPRVDCQLTQQVGQLIFREVRQQTPPPPEVLFERLNFRGEYFITQREGLVTSAAVMTQCSPSESEINYLVTRPSYRRHGLASAMMAFLEEHARGQGAEVLSLFPVGKSEDFYIKRGFHRHGAYLEKSLA